MRIIIPLVLILIGLIGGAVAGHILRPSEVAEAARSTERARKSLTYVKLPNQFVIPILERGRVGAMIVMSLSIEVPEAISEQVLLREPRLRDEILQVLFDHANNGGFRGTFTESGNLANIRRALLEVSQKTIGPEVSDVLITDIARQDT